MGPNGWRLPATGAAIRSGRSDSCPGLPGYHRCSVDTLVVTALFSALTSAIIQDW